MAKKGARDIALDVLNRVEEHKSYSNLELRNVLDRSEISAADAGLVTELVYGTIQRRLTLDFVLSQFVGGKKVQTWVRNLLLLSLYQIRFLDRIPERAAVHEAVEIAKRRGHQGISSMVNGVLRSVLRQPDVWERLPKGDAAGQIAVTHSHPEWLVRQWVKLYGEDETKAICEANNRAPHTSIRVNPMKITKDELVTNLREEGIDAQASVLSDQGILLDGGHAAGTRWFKEGYYTLQDESSMLVASAVAPEPGMRVLDACAAPGGKTTHLAEKMDNRGAIIANDVHPHKRDLIVSASKRLGISIIEPIIGDALDLPEKGLGTFDRVLLDAPCTGFGVIRRKPDLKWNKTPEDVRSIAQLQYQLLVSLSELVAPGGTLVYSTCTIEPMENQDIVRRFVDKHPDFVLDATLRDDLPEVVRDMVDESGAYVQILPHHFDSDGFFIARLRRKG
ncbi:16S rRNA (cytosine(967)-C(5))-methyltransferase RsmB [Brevibacillus choshinensis]|uniref:16S rRNA (cytosine(967)-C(5))-methyltransferase RsmB n=1 Tax=Brevibacillus choshinensis TaxID=54911 RepID=UPI002E1FBE8F|nr:16S rRNA (cytosine(967)-C(5))-methyltransferase RsmB [Brevibacillus choshinensis]MED4581800.1 16S rRNA (cytosine(967)-C(5))-methyltransferase RsmB [Brevibacillus choshinensis]MED4749873.1 16S rRNA (cytosine(967)-C(5))-methyltransferase RsmB [Brevibacillus choshinensis]MED4780539.1 16S rRNA (cytosine(967)-C(5))-methyltransferase RsmB [Brevibacillus choshinensis]